MKTIKQLLKEFWIPLVFSVAWTFYNVRGTDFGVSSEIKAIVNIFGPSFFLLSWLIGQIFRVQKQAKVEDNFGKMENRFIELLAELEDKTKEMIGHISGGDSFLHLGIEMLNGNTDIGMLMAHHHGNHPLYDVKARIVDLNKSVKTQGNTSFASFIANDVILDIGNMIPSHSMTLREWHVESSPQQRYNVFSTARNGSFIQLIRLEKISGKWYCATKVTNSQNEVLHEDIDSGYPRNQEGTVDW